MDLLPITKQTIKAAGGAAALARALGIKRPSVSGWTRVPDDRVRAVSELAGIPVREIRPDLAALFDPPPAPPAPQSQEAA